MMYRKASRVSLGLLAVLVLAGCATTQVRRDFDPDISFVGLKTYVLMDRAVSSNGNPALGSPLVERRIRAAVERELEMKGFQGAASGDADFKVAFHVVAEEKLDVQTLDNYSYNYYGYRRFRRPFYFGYLGPGSVTRSFVREYLEGTLILDIVDAKKNELIWRGWASKALAHNPTAERVNMYVSEAVGKILEEFPPTT